jgi:hypothetical protein
LSGLQFPSVFRFADELGGMQFFHRCLYLRQWSRFAYLINQKCSDVVFSARQVADEFQQTDDLCNSQGPAAIFGIPFESLADLVNIRAFLVDKLP